MKKLHEETWSANATGAAIICDEDGRAQGVFLFDKYDRGRARLAAQAPAMARLLLRVRTLVEGHAKASGSWHESIVKELKAMEPEVSAVLRLAGVVA